MRKTARLIALTLAMLVSTQCVASAEAKFRRKVFNPKPVAVETETEIDIPNATNNAIQQTKDIMEAHSWSWLF